MSEKEGKYIMQAEEFINIVYNSGYATKKNAKNILKNTQKILIQIKTLLMCIASMKKRKKLIIHIVLCPQL